MKYLKTVPNVKNSDITREYFCYLQYFRSREREHTAKISRSGAKVIKQSAQLKLYSAFQSTIVETGSRERKPFEIAPIAICPCSVHFHRKLREMTKNYFARFCVVSSV